jgi:hypothetical protein
MALQAQKVSTLHFEFFRLLGPHGPELRGISAGSGRFHRWTKTQGWVTVSLPNRPPTFIEEGRLEVN